MDKLEHFWFWLHLLIIFLIWTSPFFLDWKIILGFIGIYYLQLFIFSGCILSVKQFGVKDREKTFFIFLFNKIGIKLSYKKIMLFKINGVKIFLSDIILPLILLFVALIWQVVLKR